MAIWTPASNGTCGHPYRQYRVDTIIKHARQIHALISRYHSHCELTRPVAEYFEHEIRKFIPAIPEGPILQSFSSMYGLEMTPEFIKDVSALIAGNVPKLKSRSPVYFWESQPRCEWVPAYISACQEGVSPSGKTGAAYTFRIVAGTPAGKEVTKFLTSSQCYSWAPYFGFPPRWRRQKKTLLGPFQTFEQFVLLRFLVLIDPIKCRNGPMFTEIMRPAPGWILSHNTKVIRSRSRFISLARCPVQGFQQPVDFPCHHCHLGYLRCPNGTHPDTRELRLCPVCGDPKAHYRPGDAAGTPCVYCVIALKNSEERERRRKRADQARAQR